MRIYIYLLLALGSFSCVSHQQLVNFNQGPLPTQPETILNALDLRIQPEDLLQISIQSIEPEGVAPFNPPNQNQMMMMQGGGLGNVAEMFTGYFVDRDGIIELPTLGKVKVEGLTIVEAQNLIGDQIRKTVTDATVNIRFLNFKVSMMGEVANPGVLRLSNKRITLLEAFALAGDLTPYANRNNILVVREKAGKREYGRLNLQSNTFFQSPYFYLEQNDLVYVEPIPAKVGAIQDQTTRILTFGSAGLSLVTLLFAIFRK
jgi:polysaccharide biosynthesis/export protein